MRFAAKLYGQFQTVLAVTAIRRTAYNGAPINVPLLNGVYL